MQCFFRISSAIVAEACVQRAGESQTAAAAYFAAVSRTPSCDRPHVRPVGTGFFNIRPTTLERKRRPVDSTPMGTLELGTNRVVAARNRGVEQAASQLGSSLRAPDTTCARKIEELRLERELDREISPQAERLGERTVSSCVGFVTRQSFS